MRPVTKKSTRVTTTVKVHPDLKFEARSRGINMSDVLNEALKERLEKVNGGQDPFSVPEVKAMLPDTARYLKKNPKFAEGRSRLILNNTGYYISPEDLKKKLGVKEVNGKG